MCLELTYLFGLLLWNYPMMSLLSTQHTVNIGLPMSVNDSGGPMHPRNELERLDPDCLG